MQFVIGQLEVSANVVSVWWVAYVLALYATYREIWQIKTTLFSIFEMMVYLTFLCIFIPWMLGGIVFRLH